MIRRTIIGVILSVAACHAAHAHSRSESYSNWTVDEGTITGVVTVTSNEVLSLVPLGNDQSLESLFSTHLKDTVEVFAGASPCGAAQATTLNAPRGFLRIELTFACAAPPTEMRYRALFDSLPEHVHFARVFSENVLVAETVLTDRSNALTFEGVGAARHSFADFFELGIRHILSGIDHIAFLLGLLLVAGGFARGVAAVTGFTLGHSISLAAAVFGYIQADSRLVEAFIGFTVALVAVEFFRRHSNQKTALATTALAAAGLTAAAALLLGLLSGTAVWAYLGFGLFAYCYLHTGVAEQSGQWLGLAVATTCFGLIHGFGFAGFLMDSGLRGGSLVAPLLGFNLGVEAGQLALLAAFVLLGRLAGPRVVWRASPVAASLLCAIGVYWFIGRSLGA